jgi:hypothetical protein
VDNSHTSCVLVLLMAIGVVVVVVLLGLVPLRVPLPVLLYPRGARLQGR